MATEEATKFGIWPWIILGLGLFLGFVGLVGTIIAVIKTRKFLVPILIYVLILIICGFLFGIFIYQAYNYASDKDNVDSWLSNYNININENLNTAITTNTNTTNTNTATGLLKNTDYNYILDVGKKHAKKITVKHYAYPLEGITDTYYYCYDSSNADYFSYECDYEGVILFDVSVYSESQWQELVDLGVADMYGTYLGQDAGYHFKLSHPNGLMPEDMPTTDEYYNSVASSIDFAD